MIKASPELSSQEMPKFYGAFRGLWESITAVAPNEEIVFEGAKTRQHLHVYHVNTRMTGWSIHYSQTQLVRFSALLDKLFPGQLSLSSVHKITLELLLTYFESEKLDVSTHVTHDTVNTLADELYQNILRSIQEYIVTVPLWGFETPRDFTLHILGGFLFRQPDSSSNIHLKPLWELDRKVASEDRTYLYGILFFEFSAIGEQEYLRQMAIERASLVIYVLRLYIGTATEKYTASIPREISLLHSDRVPVEKVYFQSQSLGNPLGSSRVRPRHSKPYSIRSTRDFESFLNDLSFAELNSRLVTSSKNATEMEERLREAVLWFGRAVASEQMADSFLFYAISVEALVSTGNNSQDDYAICISRLVVKAIQERPFIESVFLRRHTERVHGRNLSLIVYMENLAKQLFVLRNKIAHGSFRNSNILNEVEDMENLARAVIFAVATGTWTTLQVLRQWAHSVS